MDKYAPYVISAYLVAGAILIGLLAYSVLRLINARRRLDRIEAEDAAP